MVIFCLDHRSKEKASTFEKNEEAEGLCVFQWRGGSENEPCWVLFMYWKNHILPGFYMGQA